MNTCTICNEPLRPTAAHNAKYCSRRCRNKAFRLKESGTALPLRFQHEVDSLASKLGETPETFQWAGATTPQAPLGCELLRHDEQSSLWTIGRA